jgi:hypothetical protein
MPLTTCKKCGKICSSSDESCPYCGAALLQRTLDSGEEQGQFRNAMIGFFLGFFVLFALIFTLVQNQTKTIAADSSQNCLGSACPIGTKAMTYSIQQEPYYTCKSGELSDYANYVLNVMLAQVQISGIPQKVSAITGEPEVQGKEKILLDKYRTNAGVASFEDAISMCYKGIGKLSVTVLYNPAESDSLYVSSEQNKEDKFWIPKTRLFRQQAN